jgi:hypothetical protein
MFLDVFTSGGITTFGQNRNPTIGKLVFKNLEGAESQPAMETNTQVRTLWGDNFKNSFLSTKSP